MSLNPAAEIPQTPIVTQEVEAEKTDLIVPSLFLSAAAIILGFVDPIYLSFEARPVETAAFTLLGLIILWAGTLLRHRVALYLGAAMLLLTIAVEATTQPTQLSVPLVAIWPMRILLVTLVGFSWGFLLRPPRWLRRALVAAIVPTLLVLALWGGPATGVALFGWNIYIPVTNFTPYWLAVNSQGTLYATDASGDLIWVFDSSGSPQGTIGFNHLPKAGANQPGPGILPNGFIGEINMGSNNVFTSTRPLSTTVTFVFDFCGLAIDPKDNIYTVDSIDPTGPKILRLDKDGILLDRLPVPDQYGPTKGCLAVDSEHIYLASRYGKVYVLDHAGKVQQEVDVAYQPLGLATNGNGDLLITGPNMVNKIEVSSGKVFTATLPAPPGQLHIPYQAIVVEKDDHVLVSDWGSNQVVRVDMAANEIVQSFGGQGYWPGQFLAMGGMALDPQGRIYVADWQHRVIERFTPDGKIDNVWWAARAVPETQSGDVEKD